MLFAQLLFLAAATVGLAAADQGLRTCPGGAISCEYGATGRCARLCSEKTHGPYGTTCECPDEQNGVAYTGASCIDIIRAGGRHSCS